MAAQKLAFCRSILRMLASCSEASVMMRPPWYSKSPEESFEKWGKQEVLSDMVQLRKIRAAALVLYYEIIRTCAIGVDQPFQQIDRVLAGISQVPEIDGDPHFGQQRQHIRVPDPARKGRSRLRRQVNDHALFLAFYGRLFKHTGDQVQAFVGVHDHGGRIVCVKVQ